MPWLFYTWGKRPWYPLSRRLGWPQTQSGCCGERKDLLPLVGIKPWLFSQQPTATQIVLFWIHKKDLIIRHCDKSNDLAVVGKIQILLNKRVFYKF
jgi:hypothetical protein